MDQMASSVGGMVHIDFADPADPVVEKINFDLQKAGYALCIVNSGADHADLTQEYAAITKELKDVCRFFGKEYLRQVPEGEFMAALPRLRKVVSDRAVLRAMHIYRENDRVADQVKAIKENDLNTFFKLVTDSGHSSWMYLQNVNPAIAVEKQPVGYTLALCDTLLAGKGAFRVHGGGFAGTVQAFVPLDMLEDFKKTIEENLGQGSCLVLNVRPHGGIQI